jgi:Spy/CpxP family protein refolding chaperone
MRIVRNLFITTFALFTITTPFALFAQESAKPEAAAESNVPPPPPGGGMPPMGGPERMAERAASQLNLSAEQKKKMRDIRQQKHDRMTALRSEVEAKMKGFADAFAASGSEAELRAKYQEMQLVQDKLATAHLDSLIAIHAILTPEQRREFIEHMRGMMLGGPGGKGRGKQNGGKKGNP